MSSPKRFKELADARMLFESQLKSCGLSLDKYIVYQSSDRRLDMLKMAKGFISVVDKLPVINDTNMWSMDNFDTLVAIIKTYRALKYTIEQVIKSKEFTDLKLDGSPSNALQSMENDICGCTQHFGSAEMALDIITKHITTMFGITNVEDYFDYLDCYPRKNMLEHVSKVKKALKPIEIKYIANIAVPYEFSQIEHLLKVRREWFESVLSLLRSCYFTKLNIKSIKVFEKLEPEVAKLSDGHVWNLDKN